MLSAAALEYRRTRVTASDARTIVTAADDAELLQHFAIKVGLELPEPETYAMRAGFAMESVILNEIELRHGHIGRRGEIVDHPTIANFCATLDGWRESDRCVIESKFVAPYFGRDDIFAMYYPQVAFQMACTDAAGGILAVGRGTSDPIEIECIRDADYERELLARCAAFLACMQTLTPPCVLPVIIPPERWRTVDLATEAPNWAGEIVANLAIYRETKAIVKQHETAGTTARALVPEDVGRVIAGDFTLRRDRRGVVSITKTKALS
jgi:hypothetical protein